METGNCQHRIAIKQAVYQIYFFRASAKDKGLTFYCSNTLFEGCAPGTIGKITLSPSNGDGQKLEIPVKTSKDGKTVYTGYAGSNIEAFIGYKYIEVGDRLVSKVLITLD